MLEFVVEIESRPLGVRFAHADRGETVLVHLVLENKLGHKLGLLPGDILIAVNNKSVLDIKSTEALNLFRQTQCPFNASFRRFDDDDEFDDDDDDELNDTNNNDTNNNDNNDDNPNNNDTNNDNNNETDNKVDDSNVNVKTKKLTAETEYQREQARQLQYNIETQVPKSVLKHKRQVSITLNTWKSDDVQEWLLNIGDEQEFKKYIKIFNDNNIDGKKLNGMNKTDLENIGIQPNDVQKLYNEIQKSNKIFINPPLKPIINPKSVLTTQIKKVSEANETNIDDDNDNDDDDQKATNNNENNDTTNDTTTNNDTTNNDGNNDDETAEETGDNWEVYTYIVVLLLVSVIACYIVIILLYII